MSNSSEKLKAGAPTNEANEKETDTDIDETEDTGTDNDTEGSLETKTDDSTEETLETGADDTTEGTSQSETLDTLTTQTCDTTEDASGTASTSVSHSSIRTDEVPETHLRLQDILCLEGRHIKVEDAEWARCPVTTLSDIIIENIVQIESSALEKFLEKATTEQRSRILEILPLDLPLKVTLPLLEDGTYWKRMCLQSWPAHDIWRFSDNWKSMFVHRTVQDLIENFVPDENDISDLCETLKIFTDYVTCLKILKLSKVSVKKVVIDLTSESFDEQLDEIITAPQNQIYLNFEKVFDCMLHLEELRVILSPKYINYEEFHCNIADFNCFFRGFCKLKELEKFRISNRFLNNEQLIVIIKSFFNHRSLKELDLSYNFLDDSVCDYISKMLMSQCPLESLILKYNKITDVGVKSIAAALFENSMLKTLDVSLNRIGDDGGQFLAKVLLSNKSVIDLDVSKNKMTTKTGISFASVVKNSDNIRSLKIQENYLGEVAGKLFSEASAENHKLLELDVHSCGFSNEDEGSIHEAILKNRLQVPYSTYVKNNSNLPSAVFLF